MPYTPTDWETGDAITSEKLNSIERGVKSVNSSYTPIEWQCGDTITAERLNHIEQGIANAEGGGSSDFSTATVTVTFSESVNAVLRGAEIFNDGTSEGITPFEGNDFSEPIIMPLYKGHCGAELWDEGGTVSAVQTTGNVTYMEDDGYFDITGDCTITIS